MPHMEYGFRGHPNMNFSLSMKSLFLLHNETMSIYSHLFATFYFVFLLLQDLTKSGPFSQLVTTESHMIMQFALVSSSFSMLTSTAYHTFCSCSQHAHDRFLQLDLIGIAVFMLGVAMACMY